MNAYPWLEIPRTVRFSDTDAAGVMHFQHLLGWCHQAWEDSLEQFGIPVGAVFPGLLAPAPEILNVHPPGGISVAEAHGSVDLQPWVGVHCDALSLL